MAAASNILVINDEAHHAWRVPAESKLRGVAKADIEEATRWIGGLDRIHRSRIQAPMLIGLGEISPRFVHRVRGREQGRVPSRRHRMAKLESER